jgi:hypothetical protein
MKMNTNEFWIEDQLSKHIPHLSFGVSVDRPFRNYTDERTGLQILITVENPLSGDIPDCFIEPAYDNNPYPEDFALFTFQRLRSRAENLFFNPVPLEMLFTPALKPQVLVTVDGLEAICPDDNCGYSYVTSVGEITDTTLSGTTLTVTGSDLDHVQDCVIGGS